MRGLKRNRQRGMFMIEALIAILLFAVGILGMVGMSALASAAQSDAQYRTLAAGLASRIAQEAWVKANRGPDTLTDPDLRAAALATSLKTFEHRSGGPDCAFTGNPATNPAVTQWAADAIDPSPASRAWYLPGATENMQQIRVDTVGGFNRMTVTVCWIAPSSPAKRQHVLVTYVN